jgi:predicted phage tail protein
MLVKMYGIFKEELETSFEIEATEFRQLMATLTHRLGEEKTQILYKTPMYFILGKQTSDELLVVDPNFPLFDFKKFDVLHFVPEASGDIPLAFVAAALAAAGATGTALTVAAYALTFVLNTTLMVAMSAVVNLLSATPEFSNDPSQAQLQKSSLFNGIRQTNEQGGAVPLVYGRPYMSGITISVGLYNEQFVPE